MAKTKVKQLSKNNTLAEEDVKKLREYVSNQEQAKARLGALELEKAKIISAVAQLEGQFQQFSSGLEHKYGEGIVVDVANGTYKSKEEFEAEQAKLAEENGTAKKD